MCHKVCNTHDPKNQFPGNVGGNSAGMWILFCLLVRRKPQKCKPSVLPVSLLTIY
jgi:hypothetical protein